MHRLHFGVNTILEPRIEFFMARQDDYIRTALRLPPDMHKALHDSADASGKSFNAEIIARLQSTFGSLQGSMRGFEMSAQMDDPHAGALTPEQLQLAKAVATEAVKQVVALRVEGLDLLKAGVHTAVIGPPPDQGKKAATKKPA